MSILVKLLGITLLTMTSLLYSSLLLSDTKVYDEASLSPEDAFERGMLLRSQFKNSEGLRFLKSAADRGHADSAFVMALELLSPNTAYRNETLSRSYMLQAYEQGSLSAMNYFSTQAAWGTQRQRETLTNGYFNALIDNGKYNPRNAYWLLAEFYHRIDPELSLYYLDIAIEFESPRAYLESAWRISAGELDYVFEAKAQRELNRRYLFAARAGYIPAIKSYIKVLEEKAEFSQAYEWRKTALMAGDITSLVALANIYRDSSSQYDAFVDLDKVKSAAYCALYLEVAGKDRFPMIYRQAEQCYLNSIADLAMEDLQSIENIKREMRQSVVFYHHDEIWDSISIKLE
ncbi:hypothetical protein F0231_06540 [Vibrio sp. RE86]|uniref:hypothetical protein n=1 Tax=Vibrio sp. RE86 TaxID=2607605 RepID=UPI001493D697|nr:hypothetical protein [Vibrio sp. RE86]NOH79397.1 hypothetical protein [Vibrio sp. RE86]